MNRIFMILVHFHPFAYHRLIVKRCEICKNLPRLPCEACNFAERAFNLKFKLLKYDEYLEKRTNFHKVVKCLGT